MKFDELDTAMRKYEQSIDQFILPEIYIVARLDGRNFTRLTREICKFEAPFDEKFRDFMVATTEYLMNCGFNIVYGFTESDEISLLFSCGDNTFNRKVRKINSVLAGEASAKFTSQLGKIVAFDCRTIPLPTTERVKDYFLWRQEDAHRNSLNSWCYWTLRKEGKSATVATEILSKMPLSGKNELLFERGINYNELPNWQKRGIGLYYKNCEKTGVNPLTGENAVAIRKTLHKDYELPLGEEYSALVERCLVNGIVA